MKFMRIKMARYLMVNKIVMMIRYIKIFISIKMYFTHSVIQFANEIEVSD